MKHLLIVLGMFLTLLGCDGVSNGSYPYYVCEERDLKTGYCIRATYYCSTTGFVIYTRSGNVYCISREVTPNAS